MPRNDDGGRPAARDRLLNPLRRRAFLAQAGRIAGAAALAPSLPGLLACASDSGSSRERAARPDLGYGPLRPAGPELALPEGFEYVVLNVEGDPMSDGQATPRAHDGMAVFPAGPGRLRLVRNHEVQDPPGHGCLVDPELAWDPLAAGGTTTLEIDISGEGAPRLVRDFASLGGTLINCAGGPTPWGSWLSCEETTQGLPEGWSVPHGYIFEVRASADGPEPAVALGDMGRFIHEAIAVDPETGFVYETEDVNRRSGFYRFRPRTPGVLTDGGALEMLAVRGAPGIDLRTGQRAGEWREVEWVEIRDPDPPEANRDPSAVFRQGLDLGGARFSRLEGCFYADESIYFHATNGGDAQLGQVWRYVPDSEALTLIFESPAESVLNHPDNLAVSPRGGLLICEDNSSETRLHGMTPDGEIFPFALNTLNQREFAGAGFSPDGRFLFVNIQGDLHSRGPGNPGLTLAIWGPWEEGPL